MGKMWFKKNKFNISVFNTLVLGRACHQNVSTFPSCSEITLQQKTSTTIIRNARKYFFSSLVDVNVKDGDEIYLEQSFETIKFFSVTV